MRTTIELPDELLAQAKSRAALGGLSLKQFFIEAIEQRLAPQAPKTRRPPPRPVCTFEPVAFGFGFGNNPVWVRRLKIC